MCDRKFTSFFSLPTTSPKFLRTPASRIDELRQIKTASLKTINKTMDVFLNVYDLTRFNKLLHPLGVGVYHTGVEIMNVEYAFGSHDGTYTGVYDFPATESDTESIPFREKLYIGTCHKLRIDVQAVITALKNDYPGCSYDMVNRNCNHFSNELCMQLVGKGIPSYINRAATVLGVLRCCLPLELFTSGNTPACPDEPRIRYQDSIVLAKGMHTHKAKCHESAVKFREPSEGSENLSVKSRKMQGFATFSDAVNEFTSADGDAKDAADRYIFGSYAIVNY